MSWILAQIAKRWMADFTLSPPSAAWRRECEIGEAF